jgi:hypothetical protein
MDGKLKVALQILFLIVLVWLLAAMSGVVSGATLRIGQRRGRGHRRRHHHRSFTWTATGMQGEMAPAPNQSFMPVGVNGLNF